MSATGQFTADPVLTAIAISYSNPAHHLIGAKVLPESPVVSDDFKYKQYDEAANFTVPDTRVGSRSSVRTIEIGGEEKTASTADYGLGIPLDNRTITKAEKAGFKPREQAVEQATNIVQLDREIRVAGLVSNPASYHPALTQDITDADDRIGGANGKTYEILMDMLDSCWMRPNQLTMGAAVWRALANDPVIVKKVGGAAADGKKITPADVAGVLEVNEVLVGQSRVNIKRPGQNPVLERVWGNFIAGHFIDTSASFITGGMTWGATAKYGTTQAGTIPIDIGVEGGIVVRSVESVTEVVLAPLTGFLITHPITAA
ncbi:hypothetical protein [Rhodospirillum sp. A1_3_36]|uniref:hypothetical protein n=1 Tax=Rhodospirillum sp. A1_3_36 TaxID=3391666 RepID=UPI0039A6AEF3